MIDEGPGMRHAPWCKASPTDPTLAVRPARAGAVALVIVTCCRCGSQLVDEDGTL